MNEGHESSLKASCSFYSISFGSFIKNINFLCNALMFILSSFMILLLLLLLEACAALWRNHMCLIFSSISLLKSQRQRLASKQAKKQKNEAEATCVYVGI